MLLVFMVPQAHSDSEGAERLAAATLASKRASLGAPSFKTAAESTYRILSWDDFKGDGQRPPGWGRWSTGSFAHIASTLRLGRVEVLAVETEGRWVAKPVGLVRPYAVMDKFMSAVKPGAKNDRVLAHEQLHFVISETLARELAVELTALSAEGATASEAEHRLSSAIKQRFEAAADEHDARQSAYDGDTANGVKKRLQKRWSKDLEDRFAAATRALEATFEAAIRPEG